MADTKLSGLVALSGSSLAAGDLLYVDDVSAGSSGSKSIRADNLLSLVSVGTGGVNTLNSDGSTSINVSGDNFTHLVITPNDAWSKSFQSRIGAFDNPPGARLDQVWTQGYNVGPGGRIDTADHAFGTWLEACYAATKTGPTTSSGGQVEWYLQGFALDSTSSRPLSVVYARPDGNTLINHVADRVQFSARTGETDVVSFTATGPFWIGSGNGGGENGRVVFIMAVAGGTIYFDTNAGGVTWDVRGLADAPGYNVLASNTQSSYLYKGVVNNVTKFQVAADGSITGAANLNLANLPTSDPHVPGQVWRSTNDLKISTG